LIVAPAGGGQGQRGTGGAGGFFRGADGGIGDYGLTPARGGTQTEGGQGGTQVNDVNPGEDGSFVKGGLSPHVGGLFWAGGGGGGGWYGGGGGHGAVFTGFDGGGSGGAGGSGWTGAVSDVEIQDGFNPPVTHGYVIVSWPDVDPTLAAFS